MARNIRSTGDGAVLSGDLAANNIWDSWGGSSIIYGDGFAPGIAGNGMSAPLYIGGADRIFAGDGDDWISGGHGADWIWGGPGADTFVIGSHVPINTNSITAERYVLDTGVGTGARDVFLDFVQGEDKIDVSQLLSFAHRHIDYDEAYEFIGAAEFSGDRAQIRYETVGRKTIVQIDGTDRFGAGVDGIVDAEIELRGKYALHAEDFIL